MITTTIAASKEWEVIFSEGKNWRIGIYRPKFAASAEITELEQHTCPESFLLLQGNLVMLYRDTEGRVHEKALKPMELVTFTEPHAGFSPDGSGVAFVVENATFDTVYTDVASGSETRRVSVS